MSQYGPSRGPGELKRNEIGAEGTRYKVGGSLGDDLPGLTFRTQNAPLCPGDCCCKGVGRSV